MGATTALASLDPLEVMEEAEASPSRLGEVNGNTGHPLKSKTGVGMGVA